MNNEQKSREVHDAAMKMTDVKITFKAAELCGLAQLAATFSKLGLLNDPNSNACGRKIFERAQLFVKENGVQTTGQVTEDILTTIEKGNFPDVEMEFSVIGITSMAGQMKPLAQAFAMIGGPTEAGWTKFHDEARRLALELMKLTEVESMMQALRPKYGRA